MTNYKQAFNELYEVITQTDDEAMRLHALNIKEGLLNAKDVEPTEQKPSVTQEQFNKMGYTERVKFKVEHPETYNKLAKGNK